MRKSIDPDNELSNQIGSNTEQSPCFGVGGSKVSTIEIKLLQSCTISLYVEIWVFFLLESLIKTSRCIEWASSTES